jgi:2-desacetyl-2-hydroxyethyl bacteriochlorophyllide A dehydrogenase
MKSIKIETPNHLLVMDGPMPQPGDQEVLIKVMASGICGTDIHIFRGEFMVTYPVIPGHEFSGVVEKTGSAITRFKLGDRVAVEPNIACDNCYNCLNNHQNFCLDWQGVGVTRPGGMAEYVTVPGKAAFSIGDLPFEQAAFMEPLSCVVHGIERAHIRLSDRVAVLGAGPIGLLFVQLARRQGAAYVAVAEKNATRADSARAIGADAAFNSLEELEKDSYDVVIDASGAIPLMQRTIDYARYGGTVLLFGVPPIGQAMSFDAFKVYRKGLTILSSFTSVRNSYQAIALLQSGQVDVSSLISHRLPLAEFPHGIELIEKGLDGVKKVLIMPHLV